jgi:hypothetical protein
MGGRKRSRIALAKTPRGVRNSDRGRGILRLRLSFALGREGQSSLRCDENEKGVPPRVEYVLEAQALKEARDDPRWRRSSPEILLHDGVGSKREDVAGGAGDEREAGVAEVFPQFRGKRVQVAVEACGFWPGFREVVEPEVERLVLVHPQRVKAIASAKLKNDRVDSATLAHLLRCDLLPESWKADRETQARRQQSLP